jgi:uncharacterized protein (TIGR00369 family)
MPDRLERITDPKALNRLHADGLAGVLGIEVERVENGLVSSRMRIEPRHLAPNGFLHAASVIALADTSCGNGCVAHLPEDASGFTTIELKTNFLGTAVEGELCCEARLVHGGRTTQVWDARVRVAGGQKDIALFRCTQMILRG